MLLNLRTYALIIYLNTCLFLNKNEAAAFKTLTSLLQTTPQKIIFTYLATYGLKPQFFYQAPLYLLW